MPKIDVASFEAVEGSMTSESDTEFMLRVRQPGGRTVMLSFPHTEILNIVEVAAMQLAPGRSANGQKETTAFVTTSFEIGRGPEGQPILTLMVGKSGGKISFLLSHDMPGQIADGMRKLAN